MKIAFIGIGLMGVHMAGHLLKAGHEVHIYTRTQSKAKQLIEDGAKWFGSAGEAAKGCDVAISIVGFPKDVQEIGQACIEALEKGATYIDMTTSSPKLAKELYEMGKKKGVKVIDAPVSGGPIGAKNQKLSIMIGGDEQAVKDMDSIFKIMGNPYYHGLAGKGQQCKIANQIFIASGMIGIVEGLLYAEAAGLSPVNVLKTCSGGAAGSWGLSNYGPKMLKRDWDPGFLIEHYVKDLGIAIESCNKLGIKLKGLEMAEALYHEMQDQGQGKLGTQSLLLALEKINKIQLKKYDL